jgi:tRNA-2-methylthio-N6-dimethylallyladenosine synthase
MSGVAKKLFIKTYGCQMNVYDSGRMAEALATLGFVATETPDEADLVIVNTCHVRAHAAEKVYSELGRLRLLKAARRAQGADTLIAVAGCVAQAEGAEIMRRQPAVDLVLGPQSYHRLPEAVARLTRAGAARAGGQAGVLETGFEVERKFDELPEARRPQGPSAYLTVQEGCDRFCTFCVVPYTRGAEYSRSPAEVEAEARRLVEGGALEITLLGQNVNAYHGVHAGRTLGLGDLIRRLANIEGLERIRYTTSHPRDMDQSLIDAHRDVPALMPFLHLPVQSGSDRVLDAMNRRHTAKDYLRLVERLRGARPDLALSSDFIVGFPGESEADFAATLDLVRNVGFAQAYAFKYSPRPGTPAALAEGQFADGIKEARLARLNALIAAQQLAFNRATLGRRLAVLLERRGRLPGQLAGRSPYMQAVHLAAPDAELGRIVEVEIVGAHGVSVQGQIVDSRMVDPIVKSSTYQPAAARGPIEEVRTPA